MDASTAAKSFRLETYRSGGSLSATSTQSVRCYFLSRSRLPPPPTKPFDPAVGYNIEDISDPDFLEKASGNTKEIYGGIINEVEKRGGAPVIEVYEVEDRREMRLVIGFRVSPVLASRTPLGGN